MHKMLDVNGKKIPFITIPDSKLEKTFLPSEGKTEAPSPPSDYDYLFKLHLIGDSGTGKSCLILRYCENNYISSYISTIGVDFKINTLDVCGKKVKTQVWDIAGQAGFRTAVSSYYPGAHAAIVVFDLTDQVSFNNVKTWINQFQTNNPNANVILVGAKADLKEKRVIFNKEIETLVKDSTLGIDAYVETSSLTGENVPKVFQIAAEMVLQRVAKVKELSSPLAAVKDPEIELRGHLIVDLQAYITRVSIHKNQFDLKEIDFSYGFSFFKNSRALNRKANYYLAQSLLQQLTEKKSSISTIFSNIEQQRDTIIGQYKLNDNPNYKHRGINSKELNEIINAATSTLTENQPLIAKR